MRLYDMRSWWKEHVKRAAFETMCLYRVLPCSAHVCGSSVALTGYLYRLVNIYIYIYTCIYIRISRINAKLRSMMRWSLYLRLGRRRLRMRIVFVLCMRVIPLLWSPVWPLSPDGAHMYIYINKYIDFLAHNFTSFEWGCHDSRIDVVASIVTSLDLYKYLKNAQSNNQSIDRFIYLYR